MTKFSRREIVKNSTYLATASLFLGLTACLNKDKPEAKKEAAANTEPKKTAENKPAAGDPLISLDHPTAKSLKYDHDASKIDPKLRMDKSGVAGNQQNCANCQFYKPVEGQTYGKCQLIPVAGKHVTAKGWCLTWAKKA